MSLNIYTNELEVPTGMEVVKNNDVFFNSNTYLNNSDIEKEVLKDIDNVEYVSESAFKGKFIKGVAVLKNFLSTGVKTLLNIEKNPDICFDTIECGQNVLYQLSRLHSGNAIVKNTLIVYPGDGEPCDIKYKGKLYKDFGVFIEDFFNDVGEEVSNEYKM